MYSLIKVYLKKPFQFKEYFENKLPLTISYGFFIFMFLFLFKPFQLDLLEENLLGYLLILSSLYIVIPLIFLLIIERINNKKWTKGYLVILYLLFIFILSFITWYFSGYYKDLIVYSRKLPFIRFYKYTLFLSFISTPLIYFFNKKISKFKSDKTSKLEKNITIYSENKKESLTFNVDNLIFISMEGNYASIYIFKQDKVEELVLRNTLSNIQYQLKMYLTIFRCHKSYIVNTKYISSISGNSRGYFLNSELISKKIPVSRSYRKEEIVKIIQ